MLIDVFSLDVFEELQLISDLLFKLRSGYPDWQKTKPISKLCETIALGCLFNNVRKLSGDFF